MGGVCAAQWRNPVRKVIVGAMVSMDGVMQAPGTPTENPTNGFKLGGWLADALFRARLWFAGARASSRCAGTAQMALVADRARS
jgi:hypothetical protein